MSNAAYGLLGAPLAMAALPLFVQLPAYYATHLGVALAPLGGVLFGARLLDMLQDPLLGHLLDRTQMQRRRWMLLGATVLALTFAALWLPPQAAAPGAWLAVMLVLAYGAHSLVNIAYLAWGAQLPATTRVPEALGADEATPSERGVIATGAAVTQRVLSPTGTRAGARAPGALGAIAWREGLGLAGMLAASLIPAAILAGDAAQLRTRLAAYSIGYALLLSIAMLALLRHAPAPVPRGAGGDWRETVREVMHNQALRTLLLPYFINALAVAIPATLALFYINDQLGAPQLAGIFLACYFGAAACGLPAWTALARRLGPQRCWRLGMLLSVAGFCGAALLGPGDLLAYGAVCIAAGLALGADLALPPALLAEALGERLGPGAGFGLFTLLGKLALALAGLSLPLLAWLDYQPGTGAATPLVLAYAVLPCLLKLLAIATFRSPT
ncbi:MFS transporter [Duganella radicis]|uniref:Sodium:galactoside symporter n=1 Tax=Duganella radicis TaxID=551988 RepID=A0A6L6PMH7_9BURK|nr:MFS transporter [Duganella radicis]MTV39837.1 sodium:galactoside symporter [Duganella radicis]